MVSYRSCFQNGLSKVTIKKGSYIKIQLIWQDVWHNGERGVHMSWSRKEDKTPAYTEFYHFGCSIRVVDCSIGVFGLKNSTIAPKL